MASVVRRMSTAIVTLAASKRSSTAAGSGTTKTRIAPTIVIGKTHVASRDQAASRLFVGSSGGIPSSRGRTRLTPSSEDSAANLAAPRASCPCGGTAQGGFGDELGIVVVE